MLIILGLYAGLVWLIFFRLKLLPWNGGFKGLVWTGALVIALVVIGALTYTTPTGTVSVQGVVTNIVPNVAGRVTEVAVAPNSDVNEGDVLFRIDDTVYAAEVARLEASREAALSAADQLREDLVAAEAEIESLQVQLAFGIQRRDDIIELEDRGASTTFQLQEAVSTIDQFKASIRAAEARKASLERRIAAQIDDTDVGVVEVENALAQARWNLEQTVVRAPADGRVTGVTLRPGNRATTIRGAINFTIRDDRFLIAALPQSSRGNVSVGDDIRIALRTMPGTEFTSQIAAFPTGTAEGALDTRTGLPSLRELRGSAQYPVLIASPAETNLSNLPIGSSGTALVLTEKAGAIGILAEILFWITKQMNYL
ncbi:multidrug resistance efflux pump [Aliiruegeria haliotis]|uniref:Multidrug resistance efflux pump n=1 Tax=Aliiruegeria haliotis TaxID=1280846 RepID=A0A2T0RQY0_9RHOB|nr:biotin/lipoyl-binding protein [Aliiruegeria haliotis]PRY23542.1 multidrug resistance efflux pump [Aliiruegeria haliotis]